MKKNNKAFTLVELIVVITILAILGTIAFINLQGYSLSARDGKRVSDINNIMKKIGIETSKGTSISSLITTTKTNSGLTIDGNSGSSIQGTANFVTLKEDGSKFKDPVTNGDYVLSYSVGGSGTGAYKFNQISTVNEEENIAVVKGNYYKMQSGDSPSITYNPDSTFFVVDGGVNLPYTVQEGVLANNTPPPVVCNYDQADIDVLNGELGNTIDISDINGNILAGLLTKEQWCDDVYSLNWYGGSNILPEIFTLNLLPSLILGNNGLTSLPQELWSLTNLQELSLYGNSITTLPTDIGNLTSLQALDLGGNGITTLPTEIGNLTSLQGLYLDDNLLTTLPIEIGNLTNLTVLGLSNNGLITLPEEIGNLTNLYWIFLGDNISLGNLAYSFSDSTLSRSQSGIPTGPQTMTIGGNGTNVVISVTP